MKSGWLLVLNIFSAFLYSADLSVVELPRMVEHFERCIKCCKNPDAKDIFLIYKSACEDVINKNYTSVSYPILCKLECARTTAVLGYEIFKAWIWPKLSDWKALKLQVEKLENYEEKKEASGLCVFFKWIGQTNVTEETRKILLNSHPYLLSHFHTNVPYMPYGNRDKFYAITQEMGRYCLSLVDKHDCIEKLLLAPSVGALFAFDFYYGRIDYNFSDFFLIQKIGTPSYKRVFNLKNFIPWNEFEEEIEPCFFEDGDSVILCLRFPKPRENASKSFYYKIAIGFDS